MKTLGWFTQPSTAHANCHLNIIINLQYCFFHHGPARSWSWSQPWTDQPNGGSPDRPPDPAAQIWMQIPEAQKKNIFSVMISLVNGVDTLLSRVLCVLCFLSLAVALIALVEGHKDSWTGTLIAHLQANYLTVFLNSCFLAGGGESLLTELFSLCQRTTTSLLF